MRAVFKFGMKRLEARISTSQEVSVVAEWTEMSYHSEYGDSPFQGLEVVEYDNFIVFESYVHDN